MHRLHRRFSMSSRLTLLLALAALALAACGGASSTQRVPDGAAIAADPLVASPRVTAAQAHLALELTTLPEGTARGDWLALRRADPAASNVSPVLQWLQVLDPAAGLVAPLEPLSSELRAGLDDATLEVVAEDDARLTPDKRIAHVEDTGVATVIDRGRLELVDLGDVYVLGDPFVAAADWSLFEVGHTAGALEDERAAVALRVGDRLARVGQALVRVGTTSGTVSPQVTLHLDATLDDDLAARLRTELERTSLAGLEPTVETWTGEPTCRSGLALAEVMRREATDSTATAAPVDPAATRSLDVLLVPGTTPGRVWLGWSIGPASAVVTRPADLMGGCLETTVDGALVVLRLAALAGARRWSELHQHAAHLLRADPEAVGVELGQVVSLFESHALFELGHVEAALSLLDALAASPDARDPALAASSAAALSLHRAERAFELGQVDVAARHLEGLDVAALDDGLEPTRAVLAASLALGRSPETALAVIEGSRAVEHPVLVAWRGLLEAIEAGRGGDMLGVMHELDGAGGEALAAWPGATAALLEIAARVSLSEGLSDPAGALLDEARLRYRRAGLPFRAGSALLQLAEVQAGAGELMASTETAMVAASDLAEAGAFVEAASVLLGVGARLNRALIEAPDGLDGARALELMGESLRVARLLATRANDPSMVSETWAQMGEALLRHFDDPAAAIEAYEAAALFAMRAGRPARAARAELGLATAVKRNGGSGEEVAEHVDAARHYAELSGDEALLRDIERLLEGAAAP